MQANQRPVIWTTIICTIVLVIVLVFAMTSLRPDPVVIPTASEIAAAVVVPVAQTIQIDTEQQQDIFEGVYKKKIRHLKNDAIDECAHEFSLSDVEDLFGDYVDLEFEKEFEEDREWTFYDIGLDHEDDRHLAVDGVFKVRVDNDYNEIVYGTCEVTSDDGDLEADLTFYL